MCPGDAGPAPSDAGPPPNDGNAYGCAIECIVDRIAPPFGNLAVYDETFLSMYFMSEGQGYDDCHAGYPSPVCYAEPDAATAAMTECERVAAETTTHMNENDGYEWDCRSECVDDLTGEVGEPVNLLARDDLGGTGEIRTCFSSEAITDLFSECSLRIEAWRDLNPGFTCQFTSPIIGMACDLPGAGTGTGNWDCTGLSNAVDLDMATALDCNAEAEGFESICSSPVQDTDRKFAIDTAASFVNVFQPDETTSGGVTCARTLVGSTSVVGDLWLDGGFCPLDTCPVVIGDFAWKTTSTLDLGAICGGTDLGDAPLVRLRAVDTIDLTSGPDGPGTNVVSIPPRAFVAALSFSIGSEVVGLQIENPLPGTALLDSAAERIAIDVTYLQDLVVTTREVEMHVEAAVVNHRPVADAGPDQTAGCGEAVTLTSASTDPEGAADLAGFFWAAVDPATGARLARGSGASITVTLFETTELVLTVIDAAGATDEDTVVVTLPPFEPVSIASVTATPACLWPPNHSYVPFSLGTDLVVTTTGGVCGARGPVVRIAGVESDEPDDGAGDGSTIDDALFGPRGLCVRSERSGGGDGRVYDVTVEARDARGNTAVATIAITVPHDQRPGDGCTATPAFVGDEDSRCAFGRRASSATSSGCTAGIVGGRRSGTMAGGACLAAVVFLVACRRRRPRGR